MQITYQLYLPDGKVVDEEGLRTPISEETRSRLNEMFYLGGRIMIRRPGAPPIDLDDDLEVLVINFCFRAVPPLTRGEKAVVPFFTDVGEIQLVPEGETVRLVREGQESVLYPRREFVAALTACGRRFVRFVEENLANTKDWNEKIAWFKEEEAKSVGGGE